MQIDRNRYRQERINMITVMIMYITKLSKAKVLLYIHKTQTYTNIMIGDELTLYDGYSANLLDMVEEWRRKQSAPHALCNITEQQIDQCNTWLRNMRVKNAKHGYDLLHDIEGFDRVQLRKGGKTSGLLKVKGFISTDMASYISDSLAHKKKSKPRRDRVTLKKIYTKNKAEMLLRKYDAEKYERSIREEGREEGLELTQWLLAQNRIEDLTRAINEKAYQEELLREMRR